MATSRPPRILIASSSEGLPYAEALQMLLSPQVETSVWNQGMLVPGEYVLESLESRAAEFDGAVVVATADDKVISRGAEHAVPRDNLLLEFGMFVAVFGRRRALLLVESIGATKLPSDVLGLTVLPFSRTVPTEVGIAPSASRLKVLAASWRDRPYDPQVVGRLDRVLRLSLSEIQDRSGLTSDLGIHVFLVDARVDPPQLVRVSRARSSPKSARPWGPFKEATGVVGMCWQTRASVFVDLTSPPMQSATESEWTTLEVAERYGMSFETLRISRDRYKCIGAVPITTISGGGEFLGCVSYNLGVGSTGSPSQLRTPAVDRVLDTCTEIVAIVIGR
jgi:hypothetical protein